MKKISAIIIGVSSDLGLTLSQRWLKRGWKITGSYRKKYPQVRELERAGARLVYCDLCGIASLRRAAAKIKKLCRAWDVLVMAPASLNPVGPFIKVDFKDWENSLRLNFINQFFLIQRLLAFRNKNSSAGPCVLLFSGGGINDAPTNYSAYTVSKIAAVKMAELLDAEIKDVRFVTIGPGWVKTKIHRDTLAAGPAAGVNYQRTLEKFKTDDFTPMERLLDCCDWLVKQPKKIVSGRNFHVQHDLWGREKLIKKLTRDPHLLKLRKYGSI